VRPGSTVIDYGCGSGVLAIAARMLGAGSVAGVDIDPQAIVASRANAALNGVTASFGEPGHLAPAPADIVVANILSNPLRVLAPLICGLARSGGAVVLSGILAAQRELVADAYRPWLELQPACEEEGWVCLWGVRR
jgi:ribosomal protein L11 methyltransferase